MTHGPSTLPLALHQDGVPTTDQDGALGWWMNNLVSKNTFYFVAVTEGGTPFTVWTFLK